MTSPTKLQLLGAAVLVSALVAVPAIAEFDDGGPVGSQPNGGPPQPITNACVGKAVPLTADLKRVVASKPSGTTFCLRAGTYKLTSTVITKPGDAFIGLGADQTFIRPSGLNAPLDGFRGGPNGTVPVIFAQIDIGGFTALPSSTTCNNDCGTAIWNQGLPQQGGVILRDLACHDNGTSCVGHGFGDVTATRIDCYRNGFYPDSLELDYRSSACIKLGEGSMVVRDSYIHDNAFDGLWCDWCANTHSIIQNNVIARNGRSGIYWEMSGNFDAGDNIVIRDNVIQDNGRNCDPLPGQTAEGSQLAAGITSEDGSNMLITGNTFGHNSACEEGGFRAVNAYDGPRPGVVTDIAVTNNALSGDRLGGPVQGPLCTRPGVTCAGNG